MYDFSISISHIGRRQHAKVCNNPANMIAPGPMKKPDPNSSKKEKPVAICGIFQKESLAHGQHFPRKLHQAVRTNMIHKNCGMSMTANNPTQNAQVISIPF